MKTPPGAWGTLLTRSVPAAVPSERHNCCPLTPSLAAKYTKEPTEKSPCGSEDSGPGKTSLTRTVPVAVPSLFQSSTPVEFSKAVEQAWAESEVEDVKDLRGQDWKAALARLERKFPDRWGQKERNERTDKNGGPAEHPLTIMDLVKLAYSDEDGNGHGS